MKKMWKEYKLCIWKKNLNNEKVCERIFNLLIYEDDKEQDAFSDFGKVSLSCIIVGATSLASIWGQQVGEGGFFLQ